MMPLMLSKERERSVTLPRCNTSLVLLFLGYRIAPDVRPPLFVDHDTERPIRIVDEPLPAVVAAHRYRTDPSRFRGAMGGV